jgi:hypothetical protein
MKKHNFKGIINEMRSIFIKNSPEILTGIGITGLVTTTIMAVKATPKALMLIEAEKQKENVDKLTAKETFIASWKCYVPSTIVGAVSVACIIGASSVSHKRNAALATAYTIAEATLREYQEKVIDIIGEKKEKEIRGKIIEDKLASNPVRTSEIILTERGNTLCYDTISGRYFRSDIDQIKKAENELNRRMRDEMYISLNDLYSEIGLDQTSIGDEIGWNIDRGYIDIYYDSKLASDGTPCLAIEYRLYPKSDYMY